MYHSQEKQDRILNEHVFKNHRRGVFVNIGAWDGVCFDNTLFFEKELGWTGINIEPLEDKYKELVINRSQSINLNIAINDVEGETEFLAINGPTSMLSGIQANYDLRHVKRINDEMNELHTEGKTIKVITKRLDTICKEHNIQRIHYLSIDAEGSEMNIVRSIDFNKVFIDVIGFENNYPDKTKLIIDYLKQYGYVQLPVVGGCDVFMIHKKSSFYFLTKPNLPFRVL